MVKKELGFNFVIALSGLILIASLVLISLSYGVLFYNINQLTFERFSFFLLIIYFSAIVGYFLARYLRNLDK